jgi:hypothetical protein
MIRRCLALLALAGCAVPGYTSHYYRFSGTIAGAPADATVVLEANTGYAGRGFREGKVTPTADGRFDIEILEGFCHTVWICPPLGSPGGSCMNDLESVRLRIRSGDRILFESIVPVRNRVETHGDFGYAIDHDLGEIRRRP